MNYQPLRGEPKRRHGPLRFAFALPLAAGRLLLHAGLALVRLTLTAVAGFVVALVLLNVCLALTGGSSTAMPDVRSSVAGVLHFSADWVSGDKQLPEVPTDLIDEASSTSITRNLTPDQGSPSGLVAALSELSPPQLRDIYQQAMPALQKYDAMLGDVQSALANDRDLDTFFADLDPWLNQAAATPTP